MYAVIVCQIGVSLSRNSSWFLRTLENVYSMLIVKLFFFKHVFQEEKKCCVSETCLNRSAISSRKLS